MASRWRERHTRPRVSQRLLPFSKRPQGMQSFPGSSRIFFPSSISKATVCYSRCLGRANLTPGMRLLVSVNIYPPFPPLLHLPGGLASENLEAEAVESFSNTFLRQRLFLGHTAITHALFGSQNIQNKIEPTI